MNVLRGVSARETMVRGPTPIAVYTDADGRGRLGVVIYADGMSHVFSSHSTGRMESAHRGVSELELTRTVTRVEFGLPIAGCWLPD